MSSDDDLGEDVGDSRGEETKEEKLGRELGELQDVFFGQWMMVTVDS